MLKINEILNGCRTAPNSILFTIDYDNFHRIILDATYFDKSCTVNLDISFLKFEMNLECLENPDKDIPVINAFTDYNNSVDIGFGTPSDVINSIIRLLPPYNPFIRDEMETSSIVSIQYQLATTELIYTEGYYTKDGIYYLYKYQRVYRGSSDPQGYDETFTLYPITIDEQGYIKVDFTIDPEIIETHYPEDKGKEELKLMEIIVSEIQDF